jgi:2-oxo-4-hydroxy-4-carboxy--5-ureidoimidazoline (OHCU) decarboxylase
MKETKESILEKISKDPKFSNVSKKLSDEERKKVDGIISNFVEQFILPLQDLVDQAKDPQVKQDIRKILESDKSEDKDGSGK